MFLAVPHDLDNLWMVETSCRDNDLIDIRVGLEDALNVVGPSGNRQTLIRFFAGIAVIENADDFSAQTGLPDILGLMATQMRVRHEFGLSLLACNESRLMEWENRLLKRLVDIVLSGFGLLILLPMTPFIALVVKFDSPGPLFYRQERIGEDGKPFTIYKFRSMRSDAEMETGPVWAGKEDHRRTRVGRFLRNTNIDELPQLWNVFKGDMSLVGPRPERPYFVGQFREDIPRYMGRHQIKSGLTGWAQVNGLRGSTSVEERTKFDLYYIENWSLFLDLRIIFKTFFAFKNAY